MRILIVAFAGFIYVAADIAVDHGAAIHGWTAFISAMVRSVGL
jgi:hypothetical protein